MIQNHKTQNANVCFSTKLQKKMKCKNMDVFAFCVELIRIQTHLAPQNDRLNLRFVKDEDTYGRKMTKNGCRTVI